MGAYTDAHGQHAFLLSAGTYLTLPLANSLAFGINDMGDIVGEYHNPFLVSHGFLATPTPEPSTVLQLIAALWMIALVWRRQSVRGDSPPTLVSPSTTTPASGK